MLNRLLTSLSCISAALIISNGPAYAATVTFTDAVAWGAASSGSTTIDFSTLAPAGSFKDYSTSTGLSLSGVNFLGFLSPTAFQLGVFDSQYASPFFNFGGGAELKGPGYDSMNASFTPYIHVVLPGNVTSIAANLATVSPNGLTYSIKLSDGETFSSATGARPATTFFGLTTTAPISYVDFALSDASAGNGTSGLIKNFQFATTVSGGTPPPDVPEAATLILIGTGLMAFRGLKKYKVSTGMQQV